MLVTVEHSLINELINVPRLMFIVSNWAWKTFSSFKDPEAVMPSWSR